MQALFFIVGGVLLLGVALYCKLRYGQLIALSHGNGQRTTARVIQKPGLRKKKHTFKVTFPSLTNPEATSILHVDEDIYHQTRENQELDIIYNDADLTQCAVVTGRRPSDGILFLGDPRMKSHLWGLYFGSLGSLAMLSLGALSLYGLI